MVLRGVLGLGFLAWDFGLRNNGDLGTWFYGLIFGLWV